MTFVSVAETPDKVSCNNNKAVFLRSMRALSPAQLSHLHRLHIAVPPSDGVTGRNDVSDTQAPNAEWMEVLSLPAKGFSSPVDLVQSNPSLKPDKQFGLAALP